MNQPQSWCWLDKILPIWWGLWSRNILQSRDASTTTSWPKKEYDDWPSRDICLGSICGDPQPHTVITGHPLTRSLSCHGERKKGKIKQEARGHHHYRVSEMRRFNFQFGTSEGILMVIIRNFHNTTYNTFGYQGIYIEDFISRLSNWSLVLVDSVRSS